MDIFGNDRKMRGCFTVINFGADKNGFSLSMPMGDNPFAGKAIITGLSFIEAEKFLLVPCFNNITHTYGFGFDAQRSVVTVDFMGFLIDKGGESQSNLISSIAGSYAKNRLSQSKKQASLYCGNGPPLKGFIVSLESSTASNETNIQSFQMQLLTVEPQCASK